MVAPLVWIASMLGAGIAFMTQLMVAKELGPTQFGAFATTLIKLSLVSTFSGSAASIFLIHVYSKEGTQAKRWLNGILKYLGATQCVGIIWIIATSWLSDEHLSTKIAILSLIPHMFGQITLDFIAVKNHMDADYTKIAIWSVFPAIIRLSLISLMASTPQAHEKELIYASLAFSVTGLIMISVGWQRLKDLFQGKWDREQCSVLVDTNFHTSEPSNSRVVKSILPFGVAGALYIVTNQGIALATIYLLDAKAAGIFNAAMIVGAALQQMPMLLYQKYLLPKLHLWAHSDRPKLEKLHHDGKSILCLLGFALSATTYWATPYLVPILLGNDYQESIFALQILSLALPFKYMIVGASSIILAVDIRLKIQTLGAIALMSFILLIALARPFGLEGAATASLLSDIFALFLFSRAIKHLKHK